MFAKFGTKMALRKAGLPSNALSMPDLGTGPSKDPNAPSPFANPFANFTVPQGLKSWQTPPPPPTKVAVPPVIGAKAPSSLKLPMPFGDGRPVVLVFLRHCGCPFAEKTFLELRRLANKYTRCNFVAVSHNSKESTDRWVSQLGGAWAVKVVVDDERELYANWGLGVSTAYHLLNPWTGVAMRKLGTQENIWARDVDASGNRWQVGGGWAIDETGMISFGAANKTADDITNLVEACKSLGL